MYEIDSYAVPPLGIKIGGGVDSIFPTTHLNLRNDDINEQLKNNELVFFNNLLTFVFKCCLVVAIKLFLFKLKKNSNNVLKSETKLFIYLT